MENFNVYPLYDVMPVRAEGHYVYDEQDKKYLDFYGGHAVVSIGHNHPHYQKRIKDQLDRIGFYSNAVINPLQKEYATLLGKHSGYEDYQLFLVNSGAEAVENAIKIAAFQNKRKKILAFEKGFHGRTSMAVQATHNNKIQTSLDQNERVVRVPLNDEDKLKEFLTEEISCVIIEGIQGVGGIHVAGDQFLKVLKAKCEETGALLILDEIQSGFGRSGKFFAHQYSGVSPDLITIAKGMGNGFPMGGVLISPTIKPWFGMLGTTFGGNHLACAAGLAVLEVLEDEKLLDNALKMGEMLKTSLNQISSVKEVRGRGLMLAAEFDFPVKEIRSQLVYEHQVFTGGSSDPNVLRLLPPLGIKSSEVKELITKLNEALASQE